MGGGRRAEDVGAVAHAADHRVTGRGQLGAESGAEAPAEPAGGRRREVRARRREALAEHAAPVEVVGREAARAGSDRDGLERGLERVVRALLETPLHECLDLPPHAQQQIARGAAKAAYRLAVLRSKELEKIIHERRQVLAEVVQAKDRVAQIIEQRFALLGSNENAVGLHPAMCPGLFPVVNYFRRNVADAVADADHVGLLERGSVDQFKRLVHPWLKYCPSVVKETCASDELSRCAFPLRKEVYF